MENKVWFENLKLFLTPHPELYPEAGEIYTPKEGYEISFLFSGFPSMSGTYGEFEINFNSDDFLILSKRASVTRILWESVAGFELSSIPEEAVKTAKLYVLPKRKT